MKVILQIGRYQILTDGEYYYVDRGYVVERFDDLESAKDAAMR